MTSPNVAGAQEAAPLVFSPVKQVKGNARKDIEYSLKFRQQPRQARMCGEGEKGDRRPIDPPPIIQLNVVHKPLKEAGSKANAAPSTEDDPMGDKSGASAEEKGKGKEKESTLDEDPFAGQSYLQNPYYFMNATLTPATQSQEQLHLLKDGKTSYTSGQTVSSLFQLKDVDNTDAGFFVFPDLGVKVEGEFRLKLDLYEIVGTALHYCTTIFSDPFQVYTSKRYPGAEKPTEITRAISAQGVKVRLHGSAATAPPPPSSRNRVVSVKRKTSVEGALVASSKTEERKRPRTSESSIGHGHPPPESWGRRSLEGPARRRSRGDDSSDPHRRQHSGSHPQPQQPLPAPPLPPPPPHRPHERQTLGPRNGSYQDEGSQRHPQLVRRYTDESHGYLPPPPPHQPSAYHPQPPQLSYRHGVPPPPHHPSNPRPQQHPQHHQQQHPPSHNTSTPPPHHSQAARFYPSPQESYPRNPPVPPPHMHRPQSSSDQRGGPSPSNAWRTESDERAEREWRANEAARYGGHQPQPPPHHRLGSSSSRDSPMAPPPPLLRPSSEHGSRVTLPPLSSLPGRPTSSSSSGHPFRQPPSPDRFPPPQSIVPLGGRPGSSSSTSSASRPVLPPPPSSAASPLLRPSHDGRSYSPERVGMDSYRQPRGSASSIRSSVGSFSASSDRVSISSDRLSLSSDRLSFSSMSSAQSVDHRFRTTNVGAGGESSQRFSMEGGAGGGYDGRRPSEFGPLGERKASFHSLDGEGRFTGGPGGGTPLSTSRSSLPSLSEMMRERNDSTPTTTTSPPSSMAPPPVPQPRTSISPVTSSIRVFTSPQLPTSSARSSITVLDVESRPVTPVAEEPSSTSTSPTTNLPPPPSAWRPSQRMGIGNLLSSTDEEESK